MEALENLKVLKTYLLLRMNWTTVFSSSSKVELKLRVRVFKKEISLIRNNNSIKWKRLITQVIKETNLWELFMIILISREIIRVLSVIEWIAQLITTTSLIQIVRLKPYCKLQVKTVTTEVLMVIKELQTLRKLLQIPRISSNFKCYLLIIMQIEHMMIFLARGQNFNLIKIQILLSLKMDAMLIIVQTTMFSLVMLIRIWIMGRDLTEEVKNSVVVTINKLILKLWENCLTKIKMKVMLKMRTILRHTMQLSRSIAIWKDFRHLKVLELQSIKLKWTK